MITAAPHLSIVSPVYNAQGIVAQLHQEVQLVLQRMNMSYELILVDDRSVDSSWVEMKNLAKDHPELKCIRLSKNFGQHAAIMAGLCAAKGDWVVVMDCDLQDQPSGIEKLFAKATEGYDVVLAKREARTDGFSKRFFSKLFHRLYYLFTDIKFEDEVANFGIYNKKVVAEVLAMNDYVKFFPLFANWTGFNVAFVSVQHGKRFAGESSYSYRKMFSLAFNSIISFSNKPMRIVVKLGAIISLCAFSFGLRLFYKYLSGEVIVLGYSSIVLSIWFLSGVIISTIGVVGVYIGKIFDQTKGRKSFIIDEIVSHGQY